LVLSPFEMFVRTAHALARAMVSLGIWNSDGLSEFLLKSAGVHSPD
jgi:hypothetical protein